MKMIVALALVGLASLAEAERPHRLHYVTPAEDSIVGWERQSLPLGCGHFGWSIFGIVTSERVQVTHNAVLNPFGNLTNALELRLKFGETGEVADYTPELLSRYRRGGRSAYLEETHFQYGRYLLVSSSRPGTLPANLQGIWTAHDKSPLRAAKAH